MKKTGQPKLVLTTAIITLFLLAVIISSEVTARQAPFIGAAGLVLNPVQRLGYALNQRMEKAIDFYYTYDQVRQENEELKLQLGAQNEKLRQYEEVLRENVELKAMFQYKDRHAEYDYIGTNVINRSMNGLSPGYTLDQGSNNGIRKGMVVITYEGLAGQITKVYPNHSILETVSSENIAVSVVSAGRKDFEGILSGATILGRSNMAMVTELSLEAAINPGDDMVTSGIGGFYPPDIYVGKIESVAEDRGRLMKTAVVRPVVDFSGDELFYIVLPKNMEALTY